MRGGCSSAAADAETSFKHLLASSSAAGVPQIGGFRFLGCGGGGDFASSGGRLVCLPRNPISPVGSSSEFQVELDPTLEGHAQLPHQDDSRTVCVKIQLRKECRFGEQFFVVGAQPELGLWNPLNAVPMMWSDGHVWTAELDMPIGELVLFKFILREISGEFSWQPGEDRVLHTRETSNVISIFEDWENVEAQQTQERDINDKQEQTLVVQTYENHEKVVIVAENIINHINPEMDRVRSGGKVSGVEEVSSLSEKSPWPINAANEVGISDIGLITSEDILGNKEVPILVPGLNRCATTQTKDVTAKEEQVKAEPDISNIGGEIKPEEPQSDQKQEQVKGHSRLTVNYKHDPMARQQPNELASKNGEDVNDDPDQDLDSAKDPWHTAISSGIRTPSRVF